MKLAFFELEGWEEPIIRKTFPKDELYLSREKLDHFTKLDRTDFDAISIFVNSWVDHEVLDHFSKLKFITTRSTGFDHINLLACKEKGIAVAYVPGYGENTVAEFAFGLILNLTRKIYLAIDQIKETGSFALTGLRGVDLKGKILGIIGTGRIGKEVARIARGFEMSVMAYDSYPDTAAATAVGFTYASLEEVLANADIVTLHCPYNPQTHHLINMDNIKRMKKSAYLINTARGGLIETDALVTALRDGIIAGAGLDVLEEEGEVKDELNCLSKDSHDQAVLKTMIENHVLMKMPNVLITPHNAFNSQEALQRILDTTFANIRGWRTDAPVNMVPFP